MIIFFSSPPEDERLRTWTFSKNTHNNRCIRDACFLTDSKHEKNEEKKPARPRRVYWVFIKNKWCGGRLGGNGRKKEITRTHICNKKIWGIITSLPIIPGIPWLWWYGIPIHSYVNTCVCECVHANARTHTQTCKLKREGVTEEHGRPWEKEAATEASVLVWNPATKEPRIKCTMGMGCGLRERGREGVCVHMSVCVCTAAWCRCSEGRAKKKRDGEEEEILGDKKTDPTLPGFFCRYKTGDTSRKQRIPLHLGPAERRHTSPVDHRVRPLPWGPVDDAANFCSPAFKHLMNVKAAFGNASHRQSAVVFKSLHT